ncbi:hypothetical protein ACX93W_01650 [Paenibacillus sp. CAU 1782]
MNCFNCEHKRIGFSDLSDVTGMTQVSDKLYVQCAVAEPYIAEFYRENGSLKREDVTVRLPCFTTTEADKQLDRMIALAEEMLDTAKERS